ncbi:MAG: hypothetical protein IJC90_03070 [Clostridia bacterium]|nr:hypothetical protein [Clostridia bacterium]
MGFIFKEKIRDALNYNAFKKWIDEQITKYGLDDVVALNFTLCENDSKKWFIELVGTFVFWESDSDWVHYEVFDTRDIPFTIKYSGDSDEVRSVYKNYILKYLECGNYSEQLKNKACVGFLFTDGNIELLHKTQNFKLPKSISQFPYVQPMDVNMLIEVVQTSLGTNRNFRLTNRQDHHKVVEQINKKIAGILDGKPFPEAYEDIEDVAVAFGARYGYAFYQERKWKWMMVGENKETAQVCIASPKLNYCIFPLTYMLSILKGEHENNALLLWNMTENIDDNPIRKDDKKLSALS